MTTEQTTEATNDRTTKQATIVRDPENGWSAVEIRSARDAKFVTDGDGLVFDSWAEADQFVTDGLPALVGHASKKLKVTGRPVFVKGEELRKPKAPAAPAAEVVTPNVAAILEGKGVKELRTQAKAAGVKGAAKMNKAALLAALS